MATAQALGYQDERTLKLLAFMRMLAVVVDEWKSRRGTCAQKTSDDLASLLITGLRLFPNDGELGIAVEEIAHELGYEMELTPIAMASTRTN